MAGITSAVPTSFKKELGTATHDFGDAATSPIGGHTWKLALFKASVTGTYGAASTNYSDMTGNSDETTDTSSPLGYTAGGGTLTNIGMTTNSTSGIGDFADLTFSAVTLSSDGALIYNSSASNKAAQVHSFGSTKSASGGDFVLTMPAAAAGTAIFEIA